jgi:ubiquitin-like protein ATG12
MTMAASVVLDHLPKDATRALETAGEVEIAKGM